MANYWLGCIFSFVVMYLVWLLNNFVNIPFLERLCEDDLFGLSLLLGSIISLLLNLMEQINLKKNH